jgi:hypothetical protein
VKAYFHGDGTLVVEADTPVESFALKQWGESREWTTDSDKGLPLLLKFDASKKENERG